MIDITLIMNSVHTFGITMTQLDGLLVTMEPLVKYLVKENSSPNLNNRVPIQSDIQYFGFFYLLLLFFKMLNPSIRLWMLKLSKKEESLYVPFSLNEEGKAS